MYNYKATVRRIVDGDTMDVTIDLGFNVKYDTRIRLYGIDTPESRTRDLEEKKRGLAVKKYVKDLLEGKELLINSTEVGKFGRPLAIVYYGSVSGEKGTNLNKELIEKGMAKEYFGGKKKGWVFS